MRVFAALVRKLKARPAPDPDDARLWACMHRLTHENTGVRACVSAAQPCG